MINNLYIKDFAIINELNLPFKNGLTIITGETGSGKSILVKALSIALGAKTEKSDLRSGQNQAVIDVDIEYKLVKNYRRLIGASGRARSFINDEPFSEQNFRDQTSALADFHGQHEQQYIMDPKTHIDFLDRFCDLEDQVEKIEAIYNELLVINNQLKELELLKQDASNRKELLRFQINEISSVNPQLDEDLKLSSEFKRLNHLDEMIATIQRLNQSLTDNDHSTYHQLTSAAKSLEKLSAYDDAIESFIESLNQASLSIQDASSGLSQYIDTIDIDPAHLKETEERFHAVESLKGKYGGSIDAVIEFSKNSMLELDSLSGIEDKINSLNIKKLKSITSYQELSDLLHSKRMSSIASISKNVEVEMSDLNMPGSNFKVSVNQKKMLNSIINYDNEGVAFGPKGYDQVEFFLSANPGELPKPLIKIASGGEVSRIMLAIKSVLKKNDPIHTLVFDEIDTGISGKAAEKVGESLERLSKHKQVICITHLPQIASKADHHIYITKRVKNNQTKVFADYLNEKDKLEAIAELFSGDSITVEGVASAKQFRSEARG